MLVIRFARTGKKKQAYYRVVVADKKRAVTAKFIEILGNYDPHAKKLSLKQERLEEYLKNGAQPSNSVAKLLVKEGFKLPKWVKIEEKNKAPKKEPEVKPASPEASQGGEAPKVEEAPAEPAENVEEEPKAEETAEGGEQVESTEPEEVKSEEPTEGGESVESTEAPTQDGENNEAKEPESGEEAAEEAAEE